MANSLSTLLAVCSLALLTGCSKKAEEPAPVKVSAPAAVAASPAACQECIAKTACAKLVDRCDTFPEPERKALCRQVRECVDTSNCGDGKNSFTSCFCGSLKTSECLKAPREGAGAPAGACADVIRKGLEGSDLSNQQVLERFLSLRYPGGVGLAQANCAKEKGCAVQCGY